MAKQKQRFTKSELERMISAANAQGYTVDGIEADATGIKLRTSRNDEAANIKMPVKPDAVRKAAT